jgi:dihydrofolate synthase / folylpolyglutamate synthase
MTDLAAYAAAVEFCESLLRPATEHVGEAVLREHFARMGYFLSRLGTPQQRFPSMHVAGTSGKGSTTVMIGAILRAAGLKTAVHCTPYLQTPIERMQVGELYASPTQFVRLVDEMRPHIQHMQKESPYHDISYREIGVAQAFLHFANEQVDIAAIETGMGGRYDYTNHIVPLVSVIVTVDYDHVGALGPTLDRIAYHKAGIIKDGAPVVTAVAHRAALDVIQREAAARRAPLYCLPGDITCRVRSVGPDGSVFDWQSPWGMIEGLRVSLLGRHQTKNAALAAAAAMLLAQRGFPVDEQSIRRGLAEAWLPGRLEVVQRKPTVVLDGAHNPEKMRALAAALREIFPNQRPVVVVGVLAAKDVDGTLAEVVPMARSVIATSPLVRQKPAVAPDTLAAACRRYGDAVVAEPDLGEAVETARHIAGPEGLVCITGSLYMVGQARDLWVPPSAILKRRTSTPPETGTAER